MIELLVDNEALERISTDEIRDLTTRATAATYYAENLAPEEMAFIDRVVRISPECVAGAAQNCHQRLVVAISGERFCGFVVATAHAENGRELDWLMVDPEFHGAGVASLLIRAGIRWLGEARPMWLSVVRHNERAIRFYQKHGFEIDPEAECPHIMPHWIMRRG